MEPQIRILIVEDDSDINQLLCNIVRNSGYFAQPAFSGTEAMLYLDNQSWDMVLLDLMLPGLTGKEILGRLSERQDGMPVLIISAKHEQQSKVEALRTGADDYITKPFDIEEVSARIDSHLRRYRRTVQQTPKELWHKDLCVDMEAKTAAVSGRTLTLTPREYAILELMLLSPRKVFTKANLFESIWNEEFRGDDNTINVHISNVRSKLAKANPNEDYIETIWGMGYRLKT